MGVERVNALMICTAQGEAQVMLIIYFFGNIPSIPQGSKKWELEGKVTINKVLTRLFLFFSNGDHFLDERV